MTLTQNMSGKGCYSDIVLYSIDMMLRMGLIERGPEKMTLLFSGF